MKEYRSIINMGIISLFFLFILLWVQGRGQQQVVAQENEGSYYKVIAPNNILDTQTEGISLWHDYGSFGLYKVSQSAYESLSAASQTAVTVAQDMDWLMIDAQPFNTQTGEAEVPVELQAIESGASLQLVQFVGPIKQEWLDAVAAAGATPVHYIANNGYLVWADTAARAELDHMAASKEIMQYSGPYHPYYKIGESIRSRVLTANNPDETVPVVVQIYNHAGKTATQSFIRSITVSRVSDWTDILAYQNINITVRATDLLSIAQRSDVTWVGERFEPELMDEVQGQIMAGNINSDGSVQGPGYLNWLLSHGFSTKPGDYPIVDITDDGIGNGTVNSGDPTFHEMGSTSNPTRLAYIGNCTNSANGGGVDGHGHINTSIVGSYAGGASYIGFPHQDPNNYRRGLGINPFARLAGTRIFDPHFDLSACGGIYTSLIKSVQDNGAKIQSNSWGCSGCAYDDSSQAFDVGTRDADLSEVGNQQLITIFAAGNSGPYAWSIGAPGNGKNVLTVGASENVRPSDENGIWTDGCAIGPTSANDWRDVIYFSSRGPATGGRVKPETIGPGTHIQGTASTNSAYTGNSVCDRFRPSEQTIYAASSGTSHSTPAVAGVASLVYWWLQNQQPVVALAADTYEPSPAVVKAYIMNHPTYMTGVGANDTLPSNSQGYGIPNMSLMFDKTPKYVLDQAILLDNSGETWVWNGVVADPSKPVRIMLNYTDQAGEIGTSPQVNNLNLMAVVNGSTYLGNVFNDQWSVTGGTADALNNYEAVFLPAGTTGSIEITITGFNIAGDGVPHVGDDTDQDFALVCYNCIQALSADPDSQDICAPDDAVYDVRVGPISDNVTIINLSTQGNPAGTSTIFGSASGTTPFTTTLTIGSMGSAAFGRYDMDIIAMGPNRTYTTTVGLNLATAVPDVPTLLAPANGAINVSLLPGFSWNAANQGFHYQLEIATDYAFSHIIYSTDVVGTSYTRPEGRGLDMNTTYYWRIRASNMCGDSSYSAIASFTTIPTPGNCGPGSLPREIYVDDFESPFVGWTHSGTNDTWTLSAANPHSGSFAFHADNIDAVSDQRLVSPEIVLPVGEDPLTLQFWNWQHMQTDNDGCYDGGILEISNDSGATWTQITDADLLTDAYDDWLDFTTNPLHNLPVWCGNNPQPYLNSIVDISDYAGQTVQFRFRLGTDFSGERPGWDIDDVHVQSCQAAYLSADPNSQGVCAPDDAVYDVRVGSLSGNVTTINLSAQGNPVGTSATFGSASGTAPFTTTLTIGSTGLATPGRYDMDIIGTSPTRTYTTAVGLNLATAVPSVPTLLTPANGAINVSLLPDFSWNAANQGFHYQFEIATDTAFSHIVYSTNVIGTSYTWPEGHGLDMNTTYYWRVRASNKCGDSSYSAVSRFTTVPTPGSCGQGSLPREIYTNDFENGAVGWTHSGPNDTWALSGVNPHSGSFAFHADDVSAVSDQRLVSPEIALPAGEDPVTLQFWNWQRMEPYGDGCTDGGILEVSSDSGATWTQVTDADLLTDAYDGWIPLGINTNPLRGLRAWCGDNPQPYLNSIVDVSDYAGQTVQFRFRLGTNIYSWTLPGWDIDDVHVQSCQVGSVDVTLSADQAQTGTPGSPVEYTLTVTNTGTVTDTFDVSAVGVWTATPSTTSITLSAGEVATFTVAVQVPAHTLAGVSNVTTVMVRSTSVPAVMDLAQLTTTAAAVYDVTLSPDAMLTGEPGETVTHTVSLTNTGNALDTFDVSAVGVWTAMPSTMSMTLSVGEVATFTVAVQVPANALAGVSDVTTVIVSSASVPAVMDLAQLTTTAAAVYGMVLSPDAMLTGVAGETVTHTVSLTNTGNVSDTYALSVDAVWPTTLSTNSVTLAVGETMTVSVWVAVPADATGMDVATFTAVSSHDALVTATMHLTTDAGIRTIFLPFIYKP